MSAKLKCPVCGQLFDGCNTCEKNSITSWKTICDTENHFNIYIILHRYNVTKKITKEQAREFLLKCDLTGYENFQKNVVENIKNILKEEKPVVKPEVIKEILMEETVVEETVEPVTEIKTIIEEIIEIKEEVKPVKQNNKYNRKNTKK